MYKPCTSLGKHHTGSALKETQQRNRTRMINFGYMSFSALGAEKIDTCIRV